MSRQFYRTLDRLKLSPPETQTQKILISDCRLISSSMIKHRYNHIPKILEVEMPQLACSDNTMEVCHTIKLKSKRRQRVKKKKGKFMILKCRFTALKHEPFIQRNDHSLHYRRFFKGGRKLEASLSSNCRSRHSMKTPGNQNPRLSIRPEKNTGQVINMKYINNLASLKVLAEHFDVNDRKYH